MNPEGIREPGVGVNQRESLLVHRCQLVLMFWAAGCHLEGPFINVDKKGAHQPEFIRTFGRGGVEELTEVYGSLDNVSILTLAPELDNSQAVVAELASRGITVSLGESRLLLSHHLLGLEMMFLTLELPPSRSLQGQPVPGRGGCPAGGDLHHPPLQRHAAGESSSSSAPPSSDRKFLMSGLVFLSP